MNKKCHFCGNTDFKKTTVKYTYTHDDKYLMVDDVPCKKCSYCGEEYFKADVLKTIENEFNEIYFHGKIVSHEVIIPIEQYKEITIV